MTAVLVISGCTGSPGKVDSRVVDAIAHSEYLKEHNTSLDTASLRLVKEVNSTPESFYEQTLRTTDGKEIGYGTYGTIQMYQYKTSDGTIHTSNVSISGDSVGLIDVDGIAMVFVPPVDTVILPGATPQ